MRITFKFIGLTFEADVTVEDEYVVFLSLTCGGQDTLFLVNSTLLEGLEDAAFDALAAIDRQVAEDIAADQIAYRKAFED
jgi:hypothetical protein